MGDLRTVIITKEGIPVKLCNCSIHVGWTDCGCNAGWKPGIVLDPFLGSGTTALVARKLNRNFIGIEISKKYCKMAERRIKPYIEQLKLYEITNNED